MPMKTFLLSSLILVVVIIMIILFQNIAGTVNGASILFYFYTQEDSAASFILITAGLGFVAGALSTALAVSIISEGKDEEAPGGASW